MWQVLEHTRLDRQLERLPREDEALRGPLSGYRSSRLNLQFRVIYQVASESAEIRVVRITPHDY